MKKEKKIKEKVPLTTPVPDLVKIICVYSDGSMKYIKGEDLKNYQFNIKSASSLGFTHGTIFKPVEWKEI